MELGFRIGGSGSSGNNGAYILYNGATSAYWQAVTGDNTSTTVLTSSVTVAASTWYNFKIILAPTTADFYVAAPGGAYTHIGQSTTTLPTSALTGLGFAIFKVTTTTTTNSQMFLDWVKLDNEFTTAR